VNIRAHVRRAFPYLVIAVAGFALAYVIVFVFVLPSKIVPNPKVPYTPDSSDILLPIDSGVQPAPNAVTVAPPVMGSYAPPAAPVPVEIPDLVGMALPDARGVLNTLQLNTSVVRDTSSTNPPNTVLSQTPRAGARVSEHGIVTVTVSYFPPLPDSQHAARPESLPPIQAEPDTTTR
jgi:hypothetical protein